MWTTLVGFEAAGQVTGGGWRGCLPGIAVGYGDVCQVCSIDCVVGVVDIEMACFFLRLRGVGPPRMRVVMALCMPKTSSALVRGGSGNHRSWSGREHTITALAHHRRSLRDDVPSCYYDWRTSV